MDISSVIITNSVNQNIVRTLQIPYDIDFTNEQLIILIAAAKTLLNKLFLFGGLDVSGKSVIRGISYRCQKQISRGVVFT
jgi:hypothetical protein